MITLTLHDDQLKRKETLALADRQDENKEHTEERDQSVVRFFCQTTTSVSAVHHRGGHRVVASMTVSEDKSALLVGLRIIPNFSSVVRGCPRVAHPTRRVFISAAFEV